ncbi:MAG: succinate dehydrogenase, cytochrome b556 subunit [Pseudomonadota bacterium]
MKGNTRKVRPKFLNPLKIRLPLTGMVSIFHRVSGVLLVAIFPAWLYALQLSLTTPGGFLYVAAWMRTPLGVALTVVSFMVLLYHLLAGLRYLLIDAGLPMNKSRAQWSAGFVVSLTALLVIAVVRRSL